MSLLGRVACMAMVPPRVSTAMRLTWYFLISGSPWSSGTRADQALPCRRSC